MPSNVNTLVLRRPTCTWLGGDAYSERPRVLVAFGDPTRELVDGEADMGLRREDCVFSVGVSAACGLRVLVAGLALGEVTVFAVLVVVLFFGEFMGGL